MNRFCFKSRAFCKPDIRKQTEEAAKNNRNHSSEKDRKKREPKKSRKPKTKKKETVQVNRQVILEIDKNSLPNDAQFKGYETRIFQDIRYAASKRVKIANESKKIACDTLFSAVLRDFFAF